MKGKDLPTRPLAAAALSTPRFNTTRCCGSQPKSHFALPPQKCCTPRGHSLRASRFHKPVVRISCRPESLARKGANPPTPTTPRPPLLPRPQLNRRPPQRPARGRRQRAIPAPTQQTTQSLHPNAGLPRTRKPKAKQPCLRLGLCQLPQSASKR